MKRQQGTKLTIREKKFVAAKVAGKTNRAAYKVAGYSTNMKQDAADVAASNINRRPSVQAAIDVALAKHHLTPDYAIEQLAKIVGQDEELGAKRLAIKDTLELHGWNKADRPQVHVKFEGSFFQQARDMKYVEPAAEPVAEPVEGEVVEPDEGN